MKKQYVLDTNVLLHDPRSIFAFEDNDVIIPIYCIEEVDKFKSEQNDRGRAAREISRQLDALRALGSLSTGVTLEGGGTLRIVYTDRVLPGSDHMPKQDMDSKILACVVQAKEDKKRVKTIFVTMDINLRIRCDAFGILTETYNNAELKPSTEGYTGWRELVVTSADINNFYATGTLSLPKADYHPNEYFLLVSETNRAHTALARHRNGNAVKLRYNNKDKLWGLQSRNMEQVFALDLLLDDDIKLVTLNGSAGTGKTLCALAAGLHMVTEEERYHKLLVARPVISLGNQDVGFLPGDIESKMGPWLKPIYDNVEFLMNLTNEDKRKGRSAQELFDQQFIQCEPLAYIRGRSLPNEIIVVDECQSLTLLETKTILTRAGENTKIIAVGDVEQIDTPYLSATNNGLMHVIERFAHEPLAGHITFSKTERSPLAERAAKLL